MRNIFIRACYTHRYTDKLSECDAVFCKNMRQNGEFHPTILSILPEPNIKKWKRKSQRMKKNIYIYTYIYRERKRDIVSSMEIGPKTGDDKGIYRNVDGHALSVSWTFPNQFFDCLIYSSHFTSSAAI